MRNLYLHEKAETENKVAKISGFGGLAGNAADGTVGLGYARYAYNLRIGHTALTVTPGVDYARMDGALLPSSVTVGSIIMKALIYKRRNRLTDEQDNRLIYYLSDGKLYEAAFGDSQLREIPVGASNVMDFTNFETENNEVLLVFNVAGRVSGYDGYSVTSAPAPCIKGPCVYRERVYGVEFGSSNRLRWCAPRNPFVWNEPENGSGSFQFSDDGGALRRVVACGNYLYVFRDYAVYAFKGYTDSNYFLVNKIFSSAKPIFYNSAASDNNRLYFLSSDGIFSVCGTEVTRVWQDEFLLIEDPSATVGECFGGKYYLAAKLYTDGETVGDEAFCRSNNGILGISVYGDYVDIVRGVDIAGFVPCSVNGRDRLYLMNNPRSVRDMNLAMFTDDGKIYGEYVGRKWRSTYVDLGRLGMDKVIRKVHLLTYKDVTLTVRVDEKDYVFRLKGDKKVQSVTLNARGERVQIEFESYDPHFYIDGFEIEYEMTERRLYGGN